MHSKFITLQRKRVRAAEKFRRLAKSDTARIHFKNVQQAEQRIEKNRQALSEAQLRGREMEAESKHLWSQLQGLWSSLGKQTAGASSSTNMLVRERGRQ